MSDTTTEPATNVEAVGSGMSGNAPAALFDIDGTLVDSNYLHIDAWTLAIASVGIDVEQWRVHQVIGMDSRKLIAALIGEDAAADLGDRITERHGEQYAALAPRLRVFPRVQELLRAVADRGVQVVLATSAPQQELDLIARVLDLGAHVAHLTSSDDVETAKPAPDVVGAALNMAGVDAGRAVFIGDTIWDVIAAGTASVSTIGVRSGGIGGDELRDAGAVEVYEDVAHLLAHLDESALSALWR